MGAARWAAAQRLTGLTVYVWQEPDRGGETFVQRVAESLPDCRILTPPAGPQGHQRLPPGRG